MLRLAIGRVLLWFLLPAMSQAWQPHGEYLQRIAEFGDAMLAKAAEGAQKSRCQLTG
jgi:hypothetical protein